jgi:hypothetical protein
MPELTKQKISKELAMGRIAGPFRKQTNCLIRSPHII